MARIGSYTPERYLVGWRSMRYGVFHIGVRSVLRARADDFDDFPLWLASVFFRMLTLAQTRNHRVLTMPARSNRLFEDCRNCAVTVRKFAWRTG